MMPLTRRRLTMLVTALLTAAMAALGIVAATGTAQASTTRNFLVTLYGWPDNSPPGNDIAYPESDGNPTIHNAAGGTGTYANPITYATDKAELPIGTIVYYPYLHRYFIMEDDCVECDEDWTGSGPDGGPQPLPHRPVDRRPERQLQRRHQLRRRPDPGLRIRHRQPAQQRTGRHHTPVQLLGQHLLQPLQLQRRRRRGDDASTERRHRADHRVSGALPGRP